MIYGFFLSIVFHSLLISLIFFVSTYQSFKEIYSLSQQNRFYIYTENIHSIQKKVFLKNRAKFERNKEPSLNHHPPVALNKSVSSNTFSSKTRDGSSTPDRAEHLSKNFLAQQALGTPDENLITIKAHPQYPKASRRNGEEGEVLLQIKITSDGKLLDVIVEKSSGFSRLDQAAIDSIRSAQFQISSTNSHNIIHKYLKLIFKLH